jgi:hypothetical protein
LGRGSDLFGTAAYQPNVGIVGPWLQWSVAVVAVVVGHVIAVALAHVIALRFYGGRGMALLNPDAGADGRLHDAQPVDPVQSWRRLQPDKTESNLAGVTIPKIPCSVAYACDAASPPRWQSRLN